MGGNTNGNSNPGPGNPPAMPQGGWRQLVSQYAPQIQQAKGNPVGTNPATGLPVYGVSNGNSPAGFQNNNFLQQARAKLQPYYYGSGAFPEGGYGGGPGIPFVPGGNH